MLNTAVPHLSQIAHALADLGFFKESAFDAVAGQAERVARDGCEHDCCIILWSLAVAGRLKEHEEAVNVLWDEITRRDVGKIQLNSRKQLKTVILFAETEGIKLEAGEDVRSGRRGLARGAKRRSVANTVYNIVLTSQTSPPSRHPSLIAVSDCY